MRQLKLQMQLTLDGFAAGPNGDLSWMTPDWDKELNDHVGALTGPVDLILLGRKMSGGFIDHWARVAADPDHPEYWAGRKFTDTSKIVFSRTQQAIEGNNVRLMQEADHAAINELKREQGGDIMVYGGAGFVASLIQQGLIDEYHLFINPVAIGKGMSVFNRLNEPSSLKLVDARAYSCGIAGLVYRRE